MNVIVRSLAVLMLVIPTFVLAQGAGSGAVDFSEDLTKEKRAKIKVLKIGYLTERLSLTSEEAAEFWPAYNDFQKKRKELRKEFKVEKSQNVEAMSDAEVEKIVEGQRKKREQMFLLENDFHAKVKGILPIKKVYLLGKAEREFKKVLIRRMQKKKGRRKGV